MEGGAHARRCLSVRLIVSAATDLLFQRVDGVPHFSLASPDGRCKLRHVRLDLIERTAATAAAA